MFLVVTVILWFVRDLSLDPLQLICSQIDQTEFNTFFLALLPWKEVITDYVRVLPDGEAVSVDGTHLGHNLPDNKGNRYLVCNNHVTVR